MVVKFCVRFLYFVHLPSSYLTVNCLKLGSLFPDDISVLCPLLTFSVTEYFVVTIWILLVLTYASNKCERFLHALLRDCVSAAYQRIEHIRVFGS
jgi:hypothetical protein